MGPTREGRKVVLSGDTAPCEALAVAAHQADVLVHEATFAEEETERARQTAHTTARQAAELARDAEVRMLALTHISSRYAGGSYASRLARCSRRLRHRATSTRSRCRSPSAAARRAVRWSERGRERAGGEALDRPSPPRASLIYSSHTP